MSLTSPTLLTATPRTYNFVGSCQARALGNLLFHDPAANEHVLVKANWRAHFRCADFFRQGRFDALMTRWLWELRAIRHAKDDIPNPHFTPFEYLMSDGATEIMGLVPNEPESYTLVVLCGEVDTWDICNALPEREIKLETPLRALEHLPEYEPRGTIEAATLYELIERRCEPMFAGLCALRDMGFNRLFLGGLVPPKPEREPYWQPTRLRYSVHAAFNTVFERFSVKSGIRLLPMWDAFTREDGLRDPQFFHDAVHFNSEGAVKAARLLHEALAAQ